MDKELDYSQNIRMITYFYKILYDNKDVVYVGITTRSINARFREHISKKRLNPEIYSTPKL